MIPSQIYSADNLQMHIESQQLNLNQIQKAQKAIQEIITNNKVKLDEVLAKRVAIQSTSILNLYQLVVEQWQNKQSIISEISALFMNQTIQYHQAVERIHKLQEEIDKKEQQYQNVEQKVRLYEKRVEEADKKVGQHQEIILQKKAEIQKMSAEIEELKTFCEGLQNRLDAAQSKIYIKDEQLPKECAACQQYQSLLELLKNEHLEDKNIYHAKKQQEIVQLKKQKRTLQKRIQELLDQNKLAKVELQLAEMAMKEAFSHKDASFSNRSQELNKSEDLYATKSHGQFLNGELECFSNIEQQSQQSNKARQKQQRSQNINTIPELKQDKNPEQSFQLKLSSNNDETALPNPFIKKNERELRRYNTEVLQNDLSDSFHADIKHTSVRIEKEKKTVALQCNLLKNVPKIIMFSRKETMKKQQEPSKSTIKMGESFIDNKKDKNLLSKSQNLMTKSMIVKPSNPRSLEEYGENSLSKLFSFLSSKIITNRIKIK